MIIHNCIKCDFNELITIADKCPIIEKHQCPKCKTWQWILHSRINPQSFHFKAVKVNEETKEVESINGKDANEFLKGFY